MKTRWIIALIMIVMPIQAGCLYAVRYDGPYRGKVVDKETQKPIEGAVVLGTWGVYHFGLAGGYGTYYDSKETVTDKNGTFIVQGQGVKVLSNVGPMRVLIYKAGHTFVDLSWEYLLKHRTTEDAAKLGVKWDEDVPIFSLNKVTNEERKRDYNGSLIPRHPDVPSPLLTHEINKEMIYRGL